MKMFRVWVQQSVSMDIQAETAWEAAEQVREIVRYEGCCEFDSDLWKDAGWEIDDDNVEERTLEPAPT